MSGSLVLSLAGPLQAWGAPALFPGRRPTQPHPTLSGVVGMLANALGRTRDQPIDDLAGADLTIRVDRPGTLITDYQTVGTAKEPLLTVDGKLPGKAQRHPIITERDIIADAVFTVVYQPASDDIDLEHLHAAIQQPARRLYLGRRPYSAHGPVTLGITHSSPIDALTLEIPLLAPTNPARIRIHSTAPHLAAGTTILDRPTSFRPVDRSWAPRPILTTSHDLTELPRVGFNETGAHHWDRAAALPQGTP